MEDTRLSDNIRTRAVILLALLLVAINLRPAITSVPPLIETIRGDLALSYTAVSLLTTIPVFCLGLFALLAPSVAQHLGRERGIFWALGLIGVATISRIWSESWLVLLGSTILVGIGIAVAQTLLPSLAITYYPDRTAFITGLYTAGMNTGAILGSALAVPSLALVGTWPRALALWGIFAFVGLVVWGAVLSTPHVESQSRQSTSSLAGVRAMMRYRLAWLMLLFMGMVANVFFAGITWLPPRYIALGWSEAQAGLLLSVFIFTGLGGMFVITAFGDRLLDRRPWILGMLGAVIIGTSAIAFVPLWNPWVTATVFGFGAGGLFTLSLTLLADFPRSATASDQLSSMVFTGGYMLAAIGPYVIGVVLDLGGSYPLVFSGFTATAVVFCFLSLFFSPRHHSTIQAA